MAKTLIVGLGSAHGDDQVGWRVVERLAAISSQPGTVLRRAASPGALFDWLADTDHLIVCDACQCGATPGTIHCWRWPDAPLANLRSSGCHDLTLAGVLALGKQLDLLPAEVIIFAVEGKAYLPGSPLHTPLDNAVGDVADAILRVLCSWAPVVNSQNDLHAPVAQTAPEMV